MAKKKAMRKKSKPASVATSISPVAAEEKPFNYKKDLFMRALYFLSVIAAVAAVTWFIFKANGSIPRSEDENYTIEYNANAMQKAKTSSGDIVVLTNSLGALALTGEELVPPFPVKLQEAAPGKSFNMVFLLGGFPRSFLKVLDTVDYKCVNSGGTVLIMVTPMELNRNGKFFRAAIYSFMTWKEMLTEFVPYMQFNYAADFLSYFVFPFSSYSEKVKLMFAPDMARGKEAGSDAQPYRYKYEHFYQYAVSNYQADSMSRIIQGCKKRGLKAIIVKMPQSVELRKILGAYNLNNYSKKVDAIGRKNKVPVIDYISKYDGSEYGYPDSAHLGQGSRQVFVDKLVNDLKPYLLPQ